MLIAALGFTLLDPHARELRVLHRWLSTWTGMGFSREVYNKVDGEAEIALGKLADRIKTVLATGTIPDVDAHIQETLREFRDAWTYAVWTAHFQPLTRVVSALPLDEMAHLAETLIMLQSLKEKVTLPTESVGGPIDVAMITKGDGFVWIKRNTTLMRP